MARSDGAWMLPAPPRPELNLDEDVGRPCSKREAGPLAVLPLEVLGALKVLPAPPLPVLAYEETVGCGSVTW